MICIPKILSWQCSFYQWFKSDKQKLNAQVIKSALSGYLQRTDLPHPHLLIQSQRWKHYNNVLNLFQVNHNEPERHQCLHCRLWAVFTYFSVLLLTLKKSVKLQKANIFQDICEFSKLGDFELIQVWPPCYRAKVYYSNSPHAV